MEHPAASPFELAPQRTRRRRPEPIALVVAAMLGLAVFAAFAVVTEAGMGVEASGFLRFAVLNIPSA